MNHLDLLRQALRPILANYNVSSGGTYRSGELEAHAEEISKGFNSLLPRLHMAVRERSSFDFKLIVRNGRIVHVSERRAGRRAAPGGGEPAARGAQCHPR